MHLKLQPTPVWCGGDSRGTTILVRLCLTIGVSKAPPLSNLPGAITAANEIGAWAENSGFVTRVVTDDGAETVTIPRLRKTLEEMLPDNDEVELFVLHFAGHGFRIGAEQNVWLPSDFDHEMRGISVEGLKKQLYMRGIRNLTILSDACRSLPASVQIADLMPDHVLPRGRYAVDSPIIDRFNAVSDGEQAFMLKGDAGSPARCVFSTILYEGLTGHAKAFDKHLPDCVIPESLALFSKERMQEICELYQLDCTPEFTTGIPREHVIYHQRGSSPKGNTPTPSWPEPPDGPDAIIANWNASPHVHRRDTREGIEQRLRDTRQSFRFDKKVIRSKFNLVVLGRDPVRVWSRDNCARSKNQTGWFKVDVPHHGATQILVEFIDGTVASAVVYDQLATVLSVDDEGVIGWTCINPWEDVERQINHSIGAIADLQHGSLTANEVDEIAMTLRELKHVSPILGAIASHLYDYSGDTDSIRRMAYFYCYYSQPIPFDIAFLGLLSHEQVDSGYHVTVPGVAARPPSSHADSLPDWVTRETKPSSGLVAGYWPWLRQGWDFVEDPETEEKAVADSIRDVIPYLLPSQFSSFRLEGARILISKFRLEGYE